MNEEMKAKTQTTKSENNEKKDECVWGGQSCTSIE